MGVLANIDWIIIICYLAMMVSVGVWLSKRHGDFEDFFLAGRTFTTPILITTLISTYYGIDVLFGDSQLGFTDGVVAWFGYARPTYIFFLLAAFLLAGRLKKEKFKSLPDILDKYFGKKTRYVGAFASFLYSLPALSLYGFGMLGDVLLGWPPIVGMVILGGVGLIYTLTGGFWAVALTDSIQFLMMCVILALAVPFAMGEIGGFSSLHEQLDPYYFETLGDLSIWLVIIYASTGLTILVEPTFYQRIFAAKSYKHVRNALLLGILIWGAYDWIVTVLGMSAQVGVIQGLIDANVQPDRALLSIMTVALPAGILGLFISGVLSTEMSTLDSYCLVAGGNVAYDMFRPIFKPDASDAELIKMTRIGVGVSWLIGLMIALSFKQMLGLWVFMASILISSLLVPIMAGLLFEKLRSPLAGLLSSSSGLASTILLNGCVMMFGEYVAEEETFVIFIGEKMFIQEYIMYVTVPVSIVAFILGLVMDRGKRS